jgi:transposase
VKSSKELTIVDNRGYILTSSSPHPGNLHDATLFPRAFTDLLEQADRRGIFFTGSTMVLDAGFWSESIRSLCQWHGLVPLIKPNKGGMKNPEKLAHLYDGFDPEKYSKRFTVERTFAWADTYRKLVTRYEVLESTARGFRLLAYAVMNLRCLVGNSV